jgi:hypothetical protein
MSSNYNGLLSISVIGLHIMKQPLPLDIQYDPSKGSIEVKQHRGRSYISPYYCMLQGGVLEVERIEKIKDLSALALRLFLSFAWHIQGNVARVGLEFLAKELGVSPRTLYNAMTDLKNHNLAIRIGPGWYLLNPHIVWKGDSKDYPEAIKYWDSSFTSILT